MYQFPQSRDNTFFPSSGSVLCHSKDGRRTAGQRAGKRRKAQQHCDGQRPWSSRTNQCRHEGRKEERLTGAGEGWWSLRFSYTLIIFPMRHPRNHRWRWWLWQKCSGLHSALCGKNDVGLKACIRTIPSTALLCCDQGAVFQSWSPRPAGGAQQSHTERAPSSAWSAAEPQPLKGRTDAKRGNAVTALHSPAICRGRGTDRLRTCHVEDGRVHSQSAILEGMLQWHKFSYLPVYSPLHFPTKYNLCM